MGRNFSKLVLALVIFTAVFLTSTRSGHSTSGGRVATGLVEMTVGRVYASPALWNRPPPQTLNWNTTYSTGPDCAVGWWWERDDRTKGLAIYALASHPGSPNVYAGVWGDGVYRAVSGENDWSQTFLGASNEITSLAIDPSAIDPSSPTTVYAGTRGSGIFRSVNSGDSWGEPALAGQEVWSLAITSTATSIYAYAGTAGEIYTSTNGTDWDLAGDTEIGTEKFYALAVDPQYSRTAYVGTKGKGVYQTTNGGISWMLSGLDGKTVRALALHPDGSEVIYAGTESDGVFKFKSTDGGVSWPSSGLDGHKVFAIAINPRNPEFVYAGTWGDGVWVSYDGGHSWHKMPGLTDGASYVYSLTLFTPAGEDDCTVVGLQYNCQVLYAGTTDGVWARAVTSFYTLYLPLVHKG